MAARDPRTFKLSSPLMRGEDVLQWVMWLRAQFRSWEIDHPLAVDDVYDAGVRAATATVVYALGMETKLLAGGLTPELRSKMRNRRLTVAERARFAARLPWRRRLRARYERTRVATPIANIISHDWGWHGRDGHDGVDLICTARAPLHAICNARVIDVRADGWWGKGAPDPATAAKGDGIIQLECLTDLGPFRRGMHFGYGHAEGAVVSEGQLVRAGQHIGFAGLANEWHVHFMANAGDTEKGIGDRDPWPFVAYAIRAGRR